jgi:hypothetical protein
MMMMRRGMNDFMQCRNIFAVVICVPAVKKTPPEDLHDQLIKSSWVKVILVQKS